MKKLVSVLLVLILICSSAVTVFAADSQSFSQQYYAFKNFVDDCEEYYIYYYRIVPNPFVIWSSDSTQRMQEAIDYARERTITTVEELEVAYADMNSVIETMCVSKRNLEFMIYLFEKETNINNYYDEETWNNFQLVLEKGKQAYESVDEEFIHSTYIEMRNTYNNLCIYNTVKGDLNGDGVLSVLDATLAQKYLADLVEFNSSQRLLMRMKNGVTVNSVTTMQKVLVGSEAEVTCINLDDLVEYEGIDPNTRRFTYIDETINEIYYDDYYEYRFGDTYS